MKVLNIEDDAFKHNDICKVLTSCGVNTVYWEIIIIWQENVK